MVDIFEWAHKILVIGSCILTGVAVVSKPVNKKVQFVSLMLLCPGLICGGIYTALNNSNELILVVAGVLMALFVAVAWPYTIYLKLRIDKEDSMFTQGEE